jgi:hypothetical protein
VAVDWCRGRGRRCPSSQDGGGCEVLEFGVAVLQRRIELLHRICGISQGHRLQPVVSVNALKNSRADPAGSIRTFNGPTVRAAETSPANPGQRCRRGPGRSFRFRVGGSNRDHQATIRHFHARPGRDDDAGIAPLLRGQFLPETVATAPSLDTVPAKGTVHDAAVAADSVTPTSIAVTIAPTATKTMTVARRLIRIVGSGVA